MAMSWSRETREGKISRMNKDGFNRGLADVSREGKSRSRRKKLLFLILRPHRTQRVQSIHIRLAGATAEDKVRKPPYAVGELWGEVG